MSLGSRLGRWVRGGAPARSTRSSAPSATTAQEDVDIQLLEADDEPDAVDSVIAVMHGVSGLSMNLPELVEDLRTTLFVGPSGRASLVRIATWPCSPDTDAGVLAAARIDQEVASGTVERDGPAAVLTTGGTPAPFHLTPYARMDENGIRYVGIDALSCHEGLAISARAEVYDAITPAIRAAESARGTDADDLPHWATHGEVLIDVLSTIAFDSRRDPAGDPSDRPGVRQGLFGLTVEVPRGWQMRSVATFRTSDTLQTWGLETWPVPPEGATSDFADWIVELSKELDPTHRERAPRVPFDLPGFPRALLLESLITDEDGDDYVMVDVVAAFKGVGVRLSVDIPDFAYDDEMAEVLSCMSSCLFTLVPVSVILRF